MKKEKTHLPTYIFYVNVRVSKAIVCFMLLKFLRGCFFKVSQKRPLEQLCTERLKVDCCYSLDVGENICKLKFAYGTEFVRLAKSSTLEGPMQFRHLGHTMADGIKC